MILTLMSELNIYFRPPKMFNFIAKTATNYKGDNVFCEVRSYFQLFSKGFSNLNSQRLIPFNRYTDNLN
jgi:hypothetical protein